MTKPKYKPGDWMVTTHLFCNNPELPLYGVRGARGQQVAGDIKTISIANLIAAAPDLHKSEKGWMDFCDTIEHYPDDTISIGELKDMMRPRGKASFKSLAKAEGK